MIKICKNVALTKILTLWFCTLKQLTKNIRKRQMNTTSEHVFWSKAILSLLHLTSFPWEWEWMKGVKKKWFMAQDWCAFMISKIMISYLLCLGHFWKWREIDHSTAIMMKIVFLSKSVKWSIFNSPNFVLQTLTDMCLCRDYNCKNDDIVIEARTQENITKVRLERRIPLW